MTIHGDLIGNLTPSQSSSGYNLWFVSYHLAFPYGNEYQVLYDIIMNQ